ncbi:MAG: hypothetical protein AAF492_10175, partial [Verrucomicrobiota bacterium]
GRDECLARLRAARARLARVLKPGGRLVLIEVDNTTFGFDPPSAVIGEWWEGFNSFQREAGGDPEVGRKLRGFCEELKMNILAEEIIPAVSSRGHPDQREDLMAYVENLLLSGADSLIETGRIDRAGVERLQTEFGRIRARPDQHVQYEAVRVIAQV